jgi:hypothetical protein
MRRNFIGPSGRRWSVALYDPDTDGTDPLEGTADRAPRLRFVSDEVVLDLQHFPAEWLTLPEAELVALARKANPPRF